MENMYGLTTDGPTRMHPAAERPPRVSGDLVVHVAGRRGRTTCRVRDLSLTGLYLPGVRAREGGEIRFRLPLPGEAEPLDVTGRVVRCDAAPAPGVALSFSRIGWEDLLCIARYLAPRI